MQVSRESVEFHVRGRGKIYLYYTIYIAVSPQPALKAKFCALYISCKHGLKLLQVPGHTQSTLFL